MPAHYAVQPRVDKGLVYLAIGGHPLIFGELVDVAGQVGVPEVLAVAGEMLGHAGVAGQVVHALHIGHAHVSHPLHVVAEAALDNLGVFPAVVDVAHGGKGHVVAHGGGLLVGQEAQVTGVLHLVGGGHLQAAADVGAVGAGAVSAALGVAGDEQGDGGGGLKHLDDLPDPGGLNAVVAEAAQMVLGHNLPQLLVGGAAVVVEKQLAHLFLVGHAGDGGLHPGDVLVGQAIGLCAQINHSKNSLLN